jgi:hypothetical protein
MMVRVSYAGVDVIINVEAVAYSGDVLTDMVARAVAGLRESMEVAALFDVTDTDAEEAEPETAADE